MLIIFHEACSSFFLVIPSCQFAYVRSSFFLLLLPSLFLLFLDGFVRRFRAARHFRKYPSRYDLGNWMIISRVCWDITDKSWPMHAIRIILSFLFSPLFSFLFSFIYLVRHPFREIFPFPRFLSTIWFPRSFIRAFKGSLFSDNKMWQLRQRCKFLFLFN